MTLLTVTRQNNMDIFAVNRFTWKANMRNEATSCSSVGCFESYQGTHHGTQHNTAYNLEQKKSRKVSVLQSCWSVETWNKYNGQQSTYARPVCKRDRQRKLSQVQLASQELLRRWATFIMVCGKRTRDPGPSALSLKLTNFAIRS